MQLKLNKVRWKNFLSTGNYWVEVDLSGSQTTLIVGKNGSGKSTLLDAIFFVLFNRPFRNINKPQLVNTITNNDCVVELEADINGYAFRVVRGIKPAIFEIYRDGELLTQAADNRDYQAAFEKYILKVTHKTFSQIVVLGSAIYTPFMALPGMRRREVIEDLLDLEIFSRMNVLLKTKLDTADYEIQEQSHQKSLVEQNIFLNEQHIERFQTSKENQIAEFQHRLTETHTKLEKLFGVIDELEKTERSLDEAMKPIPDLNSKYQEIATLKAELSQSQRRLNKDLLFFANNDVCPTCHQQIDTDFKTHYVTTNQEQADRVNNAVTQLDEKMSAIGVKLSELTGLQGERNNTSTKLTQKKTEKRHLNNLVKELESNIVKVQSETYEVDFKKLEDLKKELEQLNLLLTNLDEDRTIMGYAAVLLKDSGIKAKIIKTFIPVINQLIGKYLNDLDFFVDFNLDEEFKETILSRNRDNFSYESFSEGEKMRLNLAILFAWRAIAKLRSSINCNLLVFDELLDSALDTEGIDDILRVIENLTVEDNVIIISHREDQISDRFNKVIRFVKNQNFSKVVE